jgi:ubiquinone/menaquinone biosynthesis C-methylase UbiE
VAVSNSDERERVSANLRTRNVLCIAARDHGYHTMIQREQMNGKLDREVEIQRRYYTDTAPCYDRMHGQEAGDNPQTFKLLCAMLQMADVKTVLEVGAGTGRGMRRLSEAMPELSVRGIEPVTALVEQATKKNGVPAGAILQAVGERLPFCDGTFDAVYSLAILHHVRQPNLIVSEMLRVARRAVIIIDGNRFGQGGWPARLLKLGLYKTRLWKIANYLKTGGKGYLLTEGDGLAYSYSVYDSFELLAAWSEQLIIIPSDPCEATSWFHPLLTAAGVVVCAVKKTH